MARDFIADFLYHLFSEDKKENPISKEAESNLMHKLCTLITHRNNSEQIQKEGQ